MEIVYRYDSSEAEYENELPLDGISIQGFHEKPEEFDSYATTIWRVENDNGLPEDKEGLINCVFHFDRNCCPESRQCYHEHDCCGCPFTASFKVEYLGKNLAYIRKLTGFNY
jgi:hypothetical protein